MTITGIYPNILTKVPQNIAKIIEKRKLNDKDKVVFTVCFGEKHILIF